MQAEAQDTYTGRFRIVSVAILIVVFACIVVGFFLGDRFGRAAEKESWFGQLFGVQDEYPESTFPAPSWIVLFKTLTITPEAGLVQITTPTPQIQANVPIGETPPPEEAAPGCGEIERVLIITVDGLRSDVITNRGMPFVLSLADQGAYTWHAETVKPSVTLPGIASLLTGYDVPRTGVDSNEYYKTPGAKIPVTTIFQLAKEAGLVTAMVAGKKHLTYFEQDEYLDYHLVDNGASDVEIANAAIQYFRGNDFDLMLVHFADVDKAGHQTEWMSPAYLTAAGRASTAIRKIITALDTAGLADSTLVIITADHGGVGTSHSDVSNPANRYIPWIAVGPCVNAGHEIQQNVHIFDTAAVALWGLGLETPADLDGAMVKEAFSIPVAEPVPVTNP